MSIYSWHEPQAKFQQLVVSVPFFANDRLMGHSNFFGDLHRRRFLERSQMQSVDVTNGT